MSIMVMPIHVIRGCLWVSGTVTPRYNAIIGRHLLGPPYKRGALWDPVDLFYIVIPKGYQPPGYPTSQA